MFDVNQKDVEDLKRRLEENKLKPCIEVFNRLIGYSKEKYQVLYEQLSQPNLMKEQQEEINRKITVAERKFNHMIDAPNLCITRSIAKKYDNNTATVLIIAGILHDIGRIDEILI